MAEIDYEVDAPYPRKIDIRTFADGGVTVTIPWRPFRLQVMLGGCLAIGLFLSALMLFSSGLSLDRLLQAVGYVLTIPAMVLVAFLLFGWRNNDATEIIAIGPRAIHLKPPNGWSVDIARSDLTGIEVRNHRRDSSEQWFVWLKFEHHGWRRVCVGRPEEDVRAVADALQKAFEATSNSKRSDIRAV